MKIIGVHQCGEHFPPPPWHAAIYDVVKGADGRLRWRLLRQIGPPRQTEGEAIADAKANEDYLTVWVSHERTLGPGEYDHVSEAEARRN